MNLLYIEHNLIKLHYGRAGRFQVPLPFLLQQAAWLYERQLSQVRAQMRKVGKSGTSNAASPTPGSAAASGSGTPGGQHMKRGGSTGMGMSFERCSIEAAGYSCN